LSLQCTPEEDVGNCHSDVVDDTTCGNQVDQPSQDFVRTARNLKECQAGEQHNEEEAEDRNTVLSGLAEDTRSAAFDSHTVERAGSTVGVGVTSGENRSNKQGVNEVRKSDNSHVLHGNDIRRCSGGTTTRSSSGNNGDELRIDVRNDDASSESSTNEEDTETPVDGLERGLDVGTRALGFGGDHRNILRADNTERCGPEGSTETFELTKGTLGSVLCERSVFEVAEPIRVVLGVSTNHCDEGESEQQENQDDLSTYNRIQSANANRMNDPVYRSLEALASTTIASQEYLARHCIKS
jgi:hypothetical protein